MRTLVAFVAFLLLVGCAALNVAQSRLSVMRQEIVELRNRVLALSGDPMIVSETWTSGHKTVTVSTKRGEFDATESVDAWKARHAADVDAAKAVYPPDSDS